MGEIVIRQAEEAEIPIIEEILSDTVVWLGEMEQQLWGADEVLWEALSKKYQINDFYIAYNSGIPLGCMVIVDYDPFLWPDIRKGESLFAHKVAVKKIARKTGVSDALMDYFKEQGRIRQVQTIRLDTHALRPKLRAFYEGHGFILVEERTFNVRDYQFFTAFYCYNIQ